MRRRNEAGKRSRKIQWPNQGEGVAPQPRPFQDTWRLPMLWRLLLGVVAALVGALVCGFAGWLYAGNYATGFVFLGQVGYEAGASSGALGGLVL